ncbi:MAG: flagellar basal-body rod protein FlgB [Petroclostridium sp.]|uniref:flagellar basal body rod protein FlgB n=1 Tax=Petroclostridium xylanilyticum TaxID=1792311 RepID=UPI000B99135A|nr:flagellar basal body rod protein FlgB [Petroclostridium xylanilyticum]MBZ4645046.1 flagellar basal-body rod protein FlgB [Clostridia bacterium]MDK2810324.1 flagellar basal-body rod protein FlgB [Petroclostridium sp.]
MGIRIFNNTSILERALDAAWLRNEAISNNLANVDTPGYKRQIVEFENFLAEALDKKKIEGYRTHDKHIPIGRQPARNIPIKIQEDRTGSQMRMDKNNVDIDAEMALLAKNNIYYNAVVQQLARQFNGLKTVIKDGGR